jgi:hypothetical protein
MKQILYNELKEVFKDTQAKVYQARIDENYGEGLFINVLSDGIKYEHTGSGYFNKSELVSIEVSIHLVDDYEVILDQAVNHIVRTIFTNANVLEYLTEVPELDVLAPDYSDLGEVNRAMVEINVILNQQEVLEPVHHNELINLNFKVVDEGTDTTLHEELIVTEI